MPEAGFTYVNDLLAEPLRLWVTSGLAKLFELFVKVVQILGPRRARCKYRPQHHCEHTSARDEKPAYATQTDSNAAADCT